MQKGQLDFEFKKILTAVDNFKVAYNELCDQVEKITYKVCADTFELSLEDVKKIHSLVLENYNDFIVKNRYHKGTNYGRLDLLMKVCIDECLYKISLKNDIEKEIEGLALDFYG